MTASPIRAADIAARLALCDLGIPLDLDTMTAEQASGLCFRLALQLEKLGREYAAQALGQPIPVSTTTTEDHHGL